MKKEPRILLVDDEINLLRSTAKTLLRAGFDVETATDIASAQEQIRVNGFDLIILDLNMPDFNGQSTKYAGLDLLKRLAVERPQTPVIINSAWDEAETAKQCLDAGATDYFVKGRNKEMLKKIRTVLHLSD